MNNLTNHWEKVDKGHRHFTTHMNSDKIKRLNNRVKTNFFTYLDFDIIHSTYDWGCGGGLHTKTLSEHTNVTPLDISTTSLAECKSYSGIEGILIDGSEELSRVDLLFCADVIHHFPSIDYLNGVLDKWFEIDPIYICAQFKVSETSSKTENYFNGYNYVNSIFLTKNYISDYLSEKFHIVSYLEEKSSNNKITHGFVVLRNNNR